MTVVIAGAEVVPVAVVDPVGVGAGDTVDVGAVGVGEPGVLLTVAVGVVAGPEVCVDGPDEAGPDTGAELVEPPPEATGPPEIGALAAHDGDDGRTRASSKARSVARQRVRPERISCHSCISFRFRLCGSEVRDRSGLQPDPVPLQHRGSCYAAA